MMRTKSHECSYLITRFALDGVLASEQLHVLSSCSCCYILKHFHRVARSTLRGLLGERDAVWPVSFRGLPGNE
ncbi:hypothetical protein Y032_0048g1708 [Ancylostoma ceylanicum]|nr:hypothetical protein Y032_0048g1708 [Ancylostoma ceylanicum]